MRILRLGRPSRLPGRVSAAIFALCMASTAMSETSIRAGVAPTATSDLSEPDTGLLREIDYDLTPAAPSLMDLSSGPFVVAALDPVASPAGYGPPGPSLLQGNTLPDPARYDSFGERVGAVKWELLGIAAFLTVINVRKIVGDSQSFRFKSEGFFGRRTPDAGIDKLAHSFNTYILSDILYKRMERKAGGGVDSAVTAGILGSSLQLSGEIFDGFERGGGFSWEDTLFNTAGAGFSILRNSLPSLRAKLDYRIKIVPNSDIYTFTGKRHFEQQWFLFAIKPAGFKGLKNTPLRFLELHIGYHAENLRTVSQRAIGLVPTRKPFFGIGFNFSEIFLKNTQSRVGKAVRTGLEYVQPAYVAVVVD